MTAAENANLARLLYDWWNARDFDRGMAQATADVEWRNIATGQSFQGPQGYRQYQTGWANAFPDAQVEVTNVIADEQGAVVEFIGRGTHTGPLVTPQGEIPPTGRPVEIRFCEVMQMQGGKLVGGRIYFDAASLLGQLGLLSPPN
jgi:predicted ester cyclase